MLSATVLTRDSERSIADTLESLLWVEEVVILDTGSIDRTLEIATSFPHVKIYHSDFCGFGPLHNRATELASHDWILSVDSDEIVSPELAQEIQTLSLNPNCLYSIPRRNFFNGKWIKGCGWNPDRVNRLYNRQSTRFSDDAVHERVLSEGLEVVELKGPLRHTSYTCIADFLDKMQLYSDLFVEQKRGKKRSSLARALLSSWYTFFYSYVAQRGFLDGYEGFVISAFRANTVYYKYLKLAESNRQ